MSNFPPINPDVNQVMEVNLAIDRGPHFVFSEREFAIWEICRTYHFFRGRVPDQQLQDETVSFGKLRELMHQTDDGDRHN